MRAALLLTLLLAGCLDPNGSAPSLATDGLACDPCRVTIETAPFGLREPAVAVDPTDPERLMATSMGFDVVADAAGTLRLMRHDSTDGGRTWSSMRLALPDATPATETYDGVPLFLPDGEPFIGGIALEGAYGFLGPAQGHARVFALRPDARAIATVAEGSGAEVMAFGVAASLSAPDKPAFGVAPDGSLLAAYARREQDTPADPMRMSFEAAGSADGGRTWTQVAAPVAASAAPGSIVATADGWAMTYLTFESREAVWAHRFACWVATSGRDAAAWDARALGACNGFPALAARGDAILVAVPRADGIALVDGARETIVASWEGEAEGIPTLLALSDGALLTYYRPDAEGSAYEAARVQRGDVVARLTLDAGISRPAGALGDYFGLAATPTGAVATWVGEEGEGVATLAARILL